MTHEIHRTAREVGWRCAATDPPPRETWVLWWGHNHTGMLPGIAYRQKDGMFAWDIVEGDLWHAYPPLPVRTGGGK